MFKPELQHCSSNMSPYRLRFSLNVQSAYQLGKSLQVISGSLSSHAPCPVSKELLLTHTHTHTLTHAPCV